MDDPKFYNKWKMKTKRFLEKEFGKEAPVDSQSLAPAQQRFQQLQRKSKKPFKKGTNYPSGTYTRAMSPEQTSKWFQGGSKGVASRMKRNPSFKAGMEKYYGATLDKSGKMIYKK